MSESTELVPVESAEGHLSERMKYAQALASADLLPAAYRRKPANVLLAMEYGHALGLDTVTAIQSVHVIEGKPTASSQLIAALVRRAGHRLRVTGDDKHAIAEIVRSDDPEFTFRSEWSIARAQAAGLAGKGVWKQYPAAMLKARAITEVARDGCPEALAGVAYTPEELGGEHPADFEAEATIVEVTPETVNHSKPELLKRAGHLLIECGVDDPVQRKAIIEMIIEHPIESPDDLTPVEALEVVDALEGFAKAKDPAAELNAWLNAA